MLLEAYGNYYRKELISERIIWFSNKKERKESVLAEATTYQFHCQKLRQMSHDKSQLYQLAPWARVKSRALLFYSLLNFLMVLRYHRLKVQLWRNLAENFSTGQNWLRKSRQIVWLFPEIWESKISLIESWERQTHREKETDKERMRKKRESKEVLGAQKE